jgi:hypothetical protein
MKTRKGILVQIAIVVCALPLLSGTARGEIWKSQQLNCELTLPSGGDWSPVASPVPAMKVAMRNLAEAKAVSLLVGDAPRDGQTLASFLPGFKKGWFKQGVSTDVSEESMTIDGRAACCLKQTIIVKGTTLRMVNTIVIDNGEVYIINASSRSTDPVDDPEIGTTLKSFHFISGAPVLPIRSPMQDPLNRLPRLIGSITFYVLVGIAVIGLIIKTTVRPKNES